MILASLLYIVLHDLFCLADRIENAVQSYISLHYFSATLTTKIFDSSGFLH